MRIAEVSPLPNWVLSVVTEDGRTGNFEASPYLMYEAFKPLADEAEFKKVSNGRYFIEWECGADLSADSIEAHWQEIGKAERRKTA